MKVKCVLCEVIETIDDDTPQAKRLRNRPIHTFMCKECDERIAAKTKKHLESGQFKLFKQSNDHLI